MLQTIRERFTGWIALVLLGIIGLALVVSFGNMNTDVTTGNFAAKVDGSEIPMSEFRRVYQNQLARQQEAFQGELPPALQDQLRRNVLEGMIQNEVIAGHAEEQGYRVSDQQVAEYIRGLPVFQVGGEFSTQSYIAVLSSQGLTPEGFEAEQRQSLAVAQLQNGIIESSFYTPTEFRRFIELEQEQRELAYAVFEPGDFLDKVEVEAAAIQDFYDQNADRLMTDESVDLEYVELRLADIADSVNVDEAAVRDYYEANAERFMSEEERRARHILIAVEDESDEEKAAEQARQLSQQLADGADFAELAREFSDDTGSAPDGGDLGWAGREVYVPAFEEALFALEPGELSDPVRSEFGYHIIELLEVRPGTRRDFEEVRESLQQELQRRQAEDGFYEIAERMDDLALENPGSLEPLAQQLGLELQRIEGFTRSGGGPFGYNPVLIEAAFSPTVLEDGENSQLLEIEDGRAAVIRVFEHHPPRVRPLEEVRDQIEEELRLKQAAEIARSRGREYLERVRADGEMQSLAGDFGGAFTETALYSRSSDQLPPELLAAAFRVAPDTLPAIEGLETGNGGFVVYRVEEVEPGRPESVPREQRDQRKALLAQQLGNASLGGLVMDLRAEANVDVSPEALQEPDSF